MVSVRAVSEEEFKIISSNFKKQAKNGKISRKDFIKVMTKHGGMGDDLANQLFDTFDTDHSGYVERKWAISFRASNPKGGLADFRLCRR